MDLSFLSSAEFWDGISKLAISPLVTHTAAFSFIVLFIYLLYRIHKSPDNAFNFSDLFINKATGKVGGSQFRLNVAFITTTWALVYMTMKGTLTEWYVGAYIGAFVLDRMLSRKSSENIEGILNGKTKEDGPEANTDASGSQN